MARGRKKLPDRIKELLGDRRGRGVPGEPLRVPEGFPPCPSELAGDARREWRRLRRVLAGSRLMTPADRGALMGYCIAFGRMIKAEQHVAEKGLIVRVGGRWEINPKTGRKVHLGYTLVQNPFLAVSNRAMDTMRKFIADLGLSPTSRGGLRLPPATPAAAPLGRQGDDLDRFLRGEGARAVPAPPTEPPPRPRPRRVRPPTANVEAAKSEGAADE